MHHILFSLTIAAALTFALPVTRSMAETTQTVPADRVTPERIAGLVNTMQIDDMLGVMQQEGLAYGKTLDEDMLGATGGADWTRILTGIYDTGTLRDRIEAAMLREYQSAPDLLTGAEAFFASPEGQKILSLEVEARRTLLDPAAKDAAEVQVLRMTEDKDPRMDLLREFAEVNDLLEMNVAGAMTSNLAFYKGLADEGAFEKDMTEDQMLSDVWNQEPDVRRDSEKWLFSFLSLAYAPLSDDELRAYTEFSRSPAGQRANTVLFAAFDEAFRQISTDLGRAVAREMQGSDI